MAHCRVEVLDISLHLLDEKLVSRLYRPNLVCFNCVLDLCFDLLDLYFDLLDLCFDFLDQKLVCFDFVLDSKLALGRAMPVAKLHLIDFQSRNTSRTIRPGLRSY